MHSTNDTTGQTIGDYRLAAPLGRGATGLVVRARHIRLDRMAAVKVFDPRLTAVSGFRQRFTDSLRGAALLQHPNIVTIYDLGEHDRRFYVAMELLDGSLRLLLGDSTNRMSLTQALEFARQAIEALAYAHSQGMVHGAIKPENMLLQREHAEANGQVVLKISDFGVAQLLPNEALSAPAYLSPEQFRGMSVDMRSDIYALGVVLYELVTDTPPFATNDLAEAAHQHTLVLPIAPRILRPEIPAALETLILRCLEKRPADRFRNANELAIAVRALQTGLPGNTTIRPRPLGGHVRVEIGQEYTALAPGTEAAIAVRLVNIGADADTYSILVEGVPDNWIEITAEPVMVEGGNQAIVTLLVTPPRTPESVVGSYDIVVRAQSLTNAAVFGAARIRWRILPYAAAHMSITPQQADGHTDASYVVQLHNDGNAGSLFMLGARDDYDALQYALAQTQVYLAPGQSIAVPLHVSAAARRIGRPKQHTFTVDAKTPAYTQHITATFSHLAAVHPGILGAALGALLLIVLLGGLRDSAGGAVVENIPTIPAAPTAGAKPTSAPEAPRVALFSIEPREISAAEPVLITWDVQGAERVVIDQLGDVPSQGQREFRPEQTTDFRLVAWSGNQEAVRIERVTVTQPVEEAPLLPPKPAPEPPAAPEAMPPVQEPGPAPERPQIPIPELPARPEGTNLLLRARQAQWSTNTGPVSFGRPWSGSEKGGWVGRARNIELEDGRRYDRLLCLFPLARPVSSDSYADETGVERFIEGQFPLPTIQPGQRFLADIGFVPNAFASKMLVQISLSDQLLYESWHMQNGVVEPLAIDLSPYAGDAGTLRLRVIAENGAQASGLYWVSPRIE